MRLGKASSADTYPVGSVNGFELAQTIYVSVVVAYGPIMKKSQYVFIVSMVTISYGHSSVL